MKPAMTEAPPAISSISGLARVSSGMWSEQAPWMSRAQSANGGPGDWSRRLRSVHECYTVSRTR